MMTLAQMEAHVRYLVEDRDSVLSQANEVWPLINEAGSFYSSLFGITVARLQGTESGGTAVGTAIVDETTINFPFYESNRTDIAKILSISREFPGILDASLYQEGNPMERLTVQELYYLRAIEGTTSGIPKWWAAWRQAFSGSLGGTWKIVIHPPPSNVGYTLSAKVELEWVDGLSGTDVPNVSIEDGYAICRLAAIQCAHILGRPRAFIQAMKQLLPAHVKSALGVVERQLAPREPREDAV